MSKNKLVPAIKNDLDKCNLNDHIKNDVGFSSAYIRFVAAVASKDGLVSLAEYEVLNNIIANAEASALASVMLLEQLERPATLSTALVELKAASQNESEDVRHAAYDAVIPLLGLQGIEGQKIAKNLADSLHLPKLGKRELEEFDCDNKQSIFQKIRRNTIGIFKDKEIRGLADICMTISGDADIERKMIAYDNNDISENEVKIFLKSRSREVLSELQRFEETLAIAEFADSTADSYLETAEKLKVQVAQRLAVVESRIEIERFTFEDDIPELVYDAGNSFELEVSNRFGTDNNKKSDAWTDIGRTSFAKEIERRVNKAVSRREDQLKLLKDDLRLFQNELQTTRTSILKQKHHTHYAHLMPGLRTLTKGKNAVDTGANVALGGGAAAIAGVGAATYFLGLAVVLPAIAPALPIFAGTMAVAAFWKWVSDPSSRLRKEVAHKRTSFESVMREQLLKAQKSFNVQLDNVSTEFRCTAVSMIKPIILEAVALKRLSSLQVKVAKRIIDRSKLAVAKIEQGL